MNRINQEEFIKRAILKHGNKFDYSKINYVNSKTKVIIICPTHGEFLQLPSRHIFKNGCPKCKNDKLSNIKTSNSNEFIYKAVKIHGDKYDYSNVVYKDSNHNVNIICKIHGSFEQKPKTHLKGCGCKKCSIINYCKKRTKSNNEFVKKANLIH
jgi:hypothetical protein